MRIPYNTDFELNYGVFFHKPNKSMLRTKFKQTNDKSDIEKVWNALKQHAEKSLKWLDAQTASNCGT